MSATRQVTGYIVGLYDPNFSGLATVEVATRKNARVTRRPGKLHTLSCEAGFGVRQIVNYFGGWDAMVRLAPVTKLRFDVDLGSLITDFQEV